MSLHVKKGDRVKVIAGKDRGRVGEVIAVHLEGVEKVTVQGVNITALPPEATRRSRSPVRSTRAASSRPRRRSMCRTSSLSFRAQGRMQ